MSFKIVIICWSNYGFRKNHSIEYAAIRLVDHLSKEMNTGILALYILIFLKLLIRYLFKFSFVISLLGI